MAVMTTFLLSTGRVRSILDEFDGKSEITVRDLSSYSPPSPPHTTDYEDDEDDILKGIGEESKKEEDKKEEDKKDEKSESEESGEEVEDEDEYEENYYNDPNIQPPHWNPYIPLAFPQPAMPYHHYPRHGQSARKTNISADAVEGGNVTPSLSETNETVPPILPHQYYPQYYAPPPLYPGYPVHPSYLQPQYPNTLNTSFYDETRTTNTTYPMAGLAQGLRNESTLSQHPQPYHPPYHGYMPPPFPPPYMYYPRSFFRPSTTTTLLPVIVYKPINLTDLLDAIRRENYNPLKMYVCLKALKEFNPVDALWVVTRNHISPTVVYKTLTKINVAPLVAYNLLNGWVDSLHYKSDIMQRLKITVRTTAKYNSSEDLQVYTLPTSLEQRIQKKFGNYTYRRLETTTLTFNATHNATDGIDENNNTTPSSYPTTRTNFTDLPTISPTQKTTEAIKVKKTKIRKRPVTILVRDLERVIGNLSVEVEKEENRTMTDRDIVACMRKLEEEKLEIQRNHSVKYRELQVRIIRLRSKLSDIHVGPRGLLRSLTCSIAVVEDWINKNPEAYQSLLQRYSGRFKKVMLRDIKKIGVRLTTKLSWSERMMKKLEKERARKEAKQARHDYEEVYDYEGKRNVGIQKPKKGGRRWGYAEEPPRYNQVRGGRGLFFIPRKERKLKKEKEDDEIDYFKDLSSSSSETDKSKSKSERRKISKSKSEKSSKSSKSWKPSKSFSFISSFSPDSKSSVLFEKVSGTVEVSSSSSESGEALFSQAYKDAMLHTAKAKLKKEEEEKRKKEEEEKKKLKKTSSEERRIEEGIQYLRRQDELAKMRREKLIRKRLNKRLKRRKRRKKKRNRK